MNTTKGRAHTTATSTARTADRVQVTAPERSIAPNPQAIAQKTASKSKTGTATTEKQISAKQSPGFPVPGMPTTPGTPVSPPMDSGTGDDKQAETAAAATPTPVVTAPLQAINYRRTTPDMLEAIEAQIRMPAARVTLLYLLVQLRIAEADAANMGEGATAAELTSNCPDNDTMQVKRWVRHLTSEATSAGLISKDSDYNTFKLLDAGHHYIRQACITRLALWRVNPRMDAAGIHAIVASEESDHPLHYTQVIEIKDREMSAPVPCKNSNAKRQGQGQGKSADHVYQSHQPLWAATMSWCRA